MAVKVTAALIAMIVNVAVGVVVLATMLIAMNGYSERDAAWGLGVFVILALIITVLMALGAFFLAGFLTRKQYGAVATATISIFVFSIVGTVLEIVSGLIGVGVAEFVRVKY